jgi:DNA polymerase elongation subunit (family B)
VKKVNGEFANIEKANGVINAIGCYAQWRDEYVVFLLDEHGKMDRQRKVKNETILTFESEEELLEAFMIYYTESVPTILTGWNICQFDIPYLYRRLDIIFDEDTANMLSPIGMIKYSNLRRQYQIAGVSCLDYFEMYQKFTFARRPSYRLDAIGMYEVGMGKVVYEGTLDDLYETDLEKFIEYNLQDVRIVVAIDKKMKLIDLVKNISHVGHTQYEDYKYSSKYIEGTILVYLHRKGIVVPNKRPEGREEFDQRLEDDDEGFAGAFVKPPMPGLYDWVYNLDLQSLYPSIIMTLNISPETKVGYVTNWNVEQFMKKTLESLHIKIDDVETDMDLDEFVEFMETNRFMLSSNGILYRSDKTGVIPEILDVWFKQRVEYKGLMKKHKKDGNDELADYYDRRQHVQKILLNSIYGVLGLPIFRFYDLDNALAVTATGQDVIKTSAKFLSSQYVKRGAEPKTESWLFEYREVLDEEVKKGRITKEEANKLMDPNDHCIYIDTDSVYFSSVSVAKNVTDMKQFTVELAQDMERQLNIFYDMMAKKLFFCNENHRFVIKGEAVCETAFWVAKKRYAMKKVYDLESGIDLETAKQAVKGLDTVRSSFPPAFQKIMSECLHSILDKRDKATLDEMILNFRSILNTMPFEAVARNTGVKNISDFDDRRVKGFKMFDKGTSAHVKASIAYNRWLRQHKLDKSYELIKDGDKIKWTYLKKNEFGIETMALKGYDDPPELVAFVNEYMDYDALFENELKNKIEDFYSALKWGRLPTDVNQSANKFFDF